jgi:hypothetical protein
VVVSAASAPGANTCPSATARIAIVDALRIAVPPTQVERNSAAQRREHRRARVVAAVDESK